MRESDDDLQRLQQLIDRSYESADAHLRSIFDERHRLDGRQLAAALDGIFEIHFATVTGDGAPIVAPLDAIFYKGSVWFGLPSGSLRARLVRRDRRVSASFTRGRFALIVHGTAREVTVEDAMWREYEALVRELYVAEYGAGWLDWYEQRRQDEPSGADGFGGYIDARVLFAKG